MKIIFTSLFVLVIMSFNSFSQDCNDLIPLLKNNLNKKLDIEKEFYLKRMIINEMSKEGFEADYGSKEDYWNQVFSEDFSLKNEFENNYDSEDLEIRDINKYRDYYAFSFLDSNGLKAWLECQQISTNTSAVTWSLDSTNSAEGNYLIKLKVQEYVVLSNLKVKDPVNIRFSNLSLDNNFSGKDNNGELSFIVKQKKLCESARFRITAKTHQGDKIRLLIRIPKRLTEIQLKQVETFQKCIEIVNNNKELLKKQLSLNAHDFGEDNPRNELTAKSCDIAIINDSTISFEHIVELYMYEDPNVTDGNGPRSGTVSIKIRGIIKRTIDNNLVVESYTYDYQESDRIVVMDGLSAPFLQNTKRYIEEYYNHIILVSNNFICNLKLEECE